MVPVAVTVMPFMLPPDITRSVLSTQLVTVQDVPMKLLAYRHLYFRDNVHSETTSTGLAVSTHGST